MTENDILKSCYNSYQNSQYFSIQLNTMEDKAKYRQLLANLQEEGLIKVGANSIGYVEITLTSYGIQICEEKFV